MLLLLLLLLPLPPLPLAAAAALSSHARGCCEFTVFWLVLKDVSFYRADQNHLNQITVSINELHSLTKAQLAHHLKNAFAAQKVVIRHLIMNPVKLRLQNHAAAHTHSLLQLQLSRQASG
jgi:hypothetical protein